MDLALLLLAVVLVGGACAVALGRVRGGLEPPVSSLPLQGLPEGPLGQADVDEVRFSLGLRGYRMEQVDAVLDRLAAELAERDARIAALETGRARPDPAPAAAPATTPDPGPGWTAPLTTEGAPR